MVKFWHFLYLKNHLTYEIGYLLKITALLNFLIVSYSLESSISDKKNWNYCYFSLLLQVLNWWRLSDFLDEISLNLRKTNF